MADADLSQTILAKSDQLNADDLIGGPIVITITKVSRVAQDQPIEVNYDGDMGKPYKPCKSMRRVLVHAWGKDGNAYVGKSLRVYRDPEVLFGGVKTGGIRISHMSHISHDFTIALAETRARRKPFSVEVLREQQAHRKTWSTVLENLGMALAAAQTDEDVNLILAGEDATLVGEKGNDKVKNELLAIVKERLAAIKGATAEEAEGNVSE